MTSDRRSLHTLTAQISSLLTRYGKLAAQASTTYSASGLLLEDLSRRKGELEVEIETNLEEMSKAIQKAEEGNFGGGIQTTRGIERHEEVLIEFRRDFSRTMSSLKEAEDRANLLGSVREEIREFKSSSNSDGLLSERNRIDSSHEMTDSLLGQAYGVRNEFRNQRIELNRISSRMNGVLLGLPLISSLLLIIKNKRRRDQLILTILVIILTLLFCYFIIL